jgi:hypothetical protein
MSMTTDFDRRETATKRHVVEASYPPQCSLLFYFVSKYSHDIVSFIVGHALATKWQWPDVPHPFLEGLKNKCPSSKWCHERNSVRYAEIMPIEENPGSILLFFLRHYHPRLYSMRTWSYGTLC